MRLRERGLGGGEWGGIAGVVLWRQVSGKGATFVFSAQRRDRLLGPPSPLCNGTGELPWVLGGRSAKFTVHVHLVQKLTISGAIPQPPHVPS
jgi:hypothetical protein